MTITETATTIDFGPLLELRAEYLARAGALAEGIANRDPDIIDEARAMLDREDQLGRAISEQVEPMLDRDGEGAGRRRADADTGLSDVVLAIRPTGTLFDALDAHDDARNFEAVQQIITGTLEYVGRQIANADPMLTRPTRLYVEAAVEQFAADVLGGVTPHAFRGELAH